MKNIQSVCENLLKPVKIVEGIVDCLLYTSPSPRD